MFDVGFSELVLLFVIGLLILGPERLPRVASQLGRWMGKARRTAHQLRMQLEREMTMNDIMRDQKKRQEQDRKDAAGSKTEQSEASSYPEDENTNESGHADAGADEPTDSGEGSGGADGVDSGRGADTADESRDKTPV